MNKKLDFNQHTVLQHHEFAAIIAIFNLIKKSYLLLVWGTLKKVSEIFSQFLKSLTNAYVHRSFVNVDAQNLISESSDLGC